MNRNYNNYYDGKNFGNYSEHDEETVVTYNSQEPYIQPPPPFQEDPTQPAYTFPTQPNKFKRNRIIGVVLFVLLILSAAIILPLLFLVPRNVSFDILPISVENTTINVTPDGFFLPVTPIVLANNENFFDILLKKVSISGSHPSYSDGHIALGTGLVTNVNLNKRSFTQFPFLFNVQFNKTLDPQLSYLSSMLTNCSDPTNSKLYFDISVDVAYKMWAKSDSMNDKRNIIFPCPVSNEEAQRYMSFLPMM